MRRARKAVFMILLLAMLMGQAACGRLFGAPTPTPMPVTLRFVFSSSLKEEKYREAATAFHLKYPHITVEVERTNNVSRRVRSGGVDVFEAEQFDFPDLLRTNAIRDLTPILESALDFPLDDFYPRLLDVFRDQGRTYGIPANVDPFVLYYNKDLCDKMGVPYPQVGWDWDDFLATARGLSLPDQQPPQYGFIPDPFGLGVWAFVYQHGGQVVDNLVKPTRATLDDPRVVEAVKWYAALAREHRVMPVVTAANTSEWQQIYRSVWQGQVGMWMLLLSERGGQTQRQRWRFAWGVVPLPQDEARVTFITATGYFIAAGSANTREGWQWIEFLTKGADLTWDVPPRRSVAQSDGYRRRVGEEVFAIAQEAAEYGMTLPSAVWLTQIPADSVNFVDEILTGKKTAEEALRSVQEVWNKAISSLGR